MNPTVIFRTALCPHCRLQGYGHIHGYAEAVRDREFTPCAACGRVIERILRMDIVEESTL
jgi:hypothetical protein